MITAVELRCPVGPRRLLAILRQSGEPIRVVSGNLIEFACADCRREQRRQGQAPEYVLHRFDVAGDLVETVVVDGTNRR